MAASYRPVVRNQRFLLPEDMSDWLPDDHLVWFLIDAVAAMDTSAFHAQRAQSGPGRPAFDPDMLLVLLCYAYATKTLSSRQIQRLCRTDAAFRVICAMDVPDHVTIARFRASHQDALVEFFTTVLQLCRSQGMVRLGVVAIDGTKIAANASRGANRREQWLRDQAKQLLDDGARIDASEDTLFGQDVGDELPATLTPGPRRARQIALALQQIDQQKQKDAAADDADDARAQAYLQAVQQNAPVPPGPPPGGVDQVELHTAWIKRAQARYTQSPPGSNARRSAGRRLRSSQAALAAARKDAEDGKPTRTPGRAARRRARKPTGQPVANLTDPDSRLMHTANGGTIQGYNVQLAVSDDHFILACQTRQDGNDQPCPTPMMDAATRAAAMLTTIPDTTGTTTDPDITVILADAGYFSEANLNAPGPRRLIAPGKNRDLPPPQTTAEPPGPDATASDKMRHALLDPANHTTYKRRGATVEPVNGHLKDGIGLRQFSRRGTPAVDSETHFACAVINLLRLHHLAATP